MTAPAVDAVDPCPGAARVGSSDGWQHVAAVSCSGCGRLLRFAWWVGGRHRCGRCRFGPGEATS